jgi:hypothetical protein
MTRSKNAQQENGIIKEIVQQIQQFRELVEYYFSEKGKNELFKLSVGGRVLFCADGLYKETTDWAARQCRLAGIDAQSVDSREVLAWPENLFGLYDHHIFLFPEAEEICKLDLSKSIVISDTTEKWKEEIGTILLPLSKIRGEETKIYSILTASILIWLVNRYIIGCVDGSEEKSLNRLRVQMQLLVDGQEAICERWRESLFGMDRLALVGFGTQTLAASCTANSLLNWAKIQSSVFSSNQFLSQSSKVIGPGWGVIFFEGNSSESSEEESIIADLEIKGARCIKVINGFPGLYSTKAQKKSNSDPDLSPILNTISGQILASSIEM